MVLHVIVESKSIIAISRGIDLDWMAYLKGHREECTHTSLEIPNKDGSLNQASL